MPNLPEQCLTVRPETSIGDLCEAIGDRLDGLTGVLSLMDDDLMTGGRLHLLEARMFLEELRNRVTEHGALVRYETADEIRMTLKRGEEPAWENFDV